MSSMRYDWEVQGFHMFHGLRESPCLHRDWDSKNWFSSRICLETSGAHKSERFPQVQRVIREQTFRNQRQNGLGESSRRVASLRKRGQGLGESDRALKDQILRSGFQRTEISIPAA